MPEDEKRKTTAVQLVKESHPRGNDFHVSEVIPVGSSEITQSKLMYVKYTRPDSKSDRSLVYFPFAGDPVTFDSSEDFIRWYTSRAKRDSVWSQLIGWTGGIAGLIALLIVAVMLWEYAHSPDKFTPPELLAHAFEIILGYYFGSRVAGGNSSSSA